MLLAKSGKRTGITFAMVDDVIGPEGQRQVVIRMLTDDEYNTFAERGVSPPTNRICDTDAHCVGDSGSLWFRWPELQEWNSQAASLKVDGVAVHHLGFGGTENPKGMGFALEDFLAGGPYEVAIGTSSTSTVEGMLADDGWYKDRCIPHR